MIAFSTQTIILPLASKEQAKKRGIIMVVCAWGAEELESVKPNGSPIYGWSTQAPGPSYCIKPIPSRVPNQDSCVCVGVESFRTAGLRQQRTRPCLKSAQMMAESLVHTIQIVFTHNKCTAYFTKIAKVAAVVTVSAA